MHRLSSRQSLAKRWTTSKENFVYLSKYKQFSMFQAIFCGSSRFEFLIDTQ